MLSDSKEGVLAHMIIKMEIDIEDDEVKAQWVYDFLEVWIKHRLPEMVIVNKTTLECDD